jgi:hypothetical protein
LRNISNVRKRRSVSHRRKSWRITFWDIAGLSWEKIIKIDLVNLTKIGGKVIKNESNSKLIVCWKGKIEQSLINCINSCLTSLSQKCIVCVCKIYCIKKAHEKYDWNVG